MSERHKQSQNNAITSFIRGYWELPETHYSVWQSFLRGVLLAFVISIFAPVNNAYELIVWGVAAGTAWAVMDYLVWRYYSKKRGV